MHDDLRSAVSADMPRLNALLADLVRLQSVSAHGYDPEPVRRSAETLRDLLAESGLQNTRLLEGGGHPAVFGELPAPDGAPTLLLYAHYDVQPPGPLEDWDVGPFEPFEKDGRLYGRGASDDKSGIIMHLGAIAAHGAVLPVGVKVFLEGEEEAGSESLPRILEDHPELLDPDVIVIGDGGNWEVGVPAFLTSLRGIVNLWVELRTLANPVHSGQYGGVFPDSLTALTRVLATLHDDEGNVAVAGLESDEIQGLEVPAELLRGQMAVAPGVEEIGSGSIPSRLWSRPAISILAVDAPRVGEAINQLVPVARAVISLRTAPGQDTGMAAQALRDHLAANAPWGTTVEVTREQTGDACVLETDNWAVDSWTSAFSEAYGTEPVKMGAGGSIPFIATFKEMFPDSPILVVGCGDPTSAIHAPNESQDLGDLERSVLSEAVAMRLLAESFPA
jgi:acetylornithine deacetylase/succinyl-diaminopimelate desuccinylase-like protein